MQGSAGRCMSRRVGRDWGRGAEGRTRDGGRVKCGNVGAVWGASEVTETIVILASGRQINTEDPPTGARNDGEGGKYRVGGPDTEES